MNYYNFYVRDCWSLNENFQCYRTGGVFNGPVYPRVIDLNGRSLCVNSGNIFISNKTIYLVITRRPTIKTYLNLCLDNTQNQPCLPITVLILSVHIVTLLYPLMTLCDHLLFLYLDNYLC